VGVDAPRERRPELALFPDLAGIGFVGCGDGVAALFARDADYRLTEADPLRRVRLLAHRVVALGAEPHRQDVISEPRRLAPGGGERDMQPDAIAVGEHLDPREAVRVGPYRVVDAREVDVEPAAVLFRKCGSRKLISKKASGYSRGKSSSFQ